MVKWQFWKKDDFADLKLPPTQESGSGLTRDGTGLDLTENFQEPNAHAAGSGASAATIMNSLGGVPQTPSLPTFPPFNQPPGSLGSQAFSGNGLNTPPLSPSSLSGVNVAPHDEIQGTPPFNAQTGSSAGGSSGVHSKDLEVVSAKLDAIKSQLDMLNLRLSTLEQRLGGQQENGGPRRPWY
jgi:hypothetical protein